MDGEGERVMDGGGERGRMRDGEGEEVMERERER